MKLNQPIGKKYPSKQDINLAMKDSRKRELKPVILTAVLLTALITAFTKFAVIDQLAKASEAEYAAAKAKVELTAVQARTADYDAVLEEYNEYNLSQSLVTGKTDALDILDLIEADMMPVSIVDSFTSSNGSITVNVSGVTLNQISQIYSKVSASPLVSGVQVLTANSEETKDAGAGPQEMALPENTQQENPPQEEAVSPSGAASTRAVFTILLKSEAEAAIREGGQGS